MFRLILGSFLSIMIVPIFIVIAYVYSKHSMYCNNQTGIKTPLFEINISLGQCDAWGNTKQEMSDYLNMLFDKVPSTSSILDDKRIKEITK